MPLDARKSIGELISQLKAEGKPQKQRVAIALSVKGKSKPKKGKKYE